MLVFPRNDLLHLDIELHTSIQNQEALQFKTVTIHLSMHLSSRWSYQTPGCSIAVN